MSKTNTSACVTEARLRRVIAEQEARIDELKAEIRELERKLNRQWTPVTERLPEPFKRVIVCREGLDEPIVEQGQLDVNGWWKVYGTRTKRVTHWMPLPEQPKEG